MARIRRTSRGWQISRLRCSTKVRRRDRRCRSPTKSPRLGGVADHCLDDGRISGDGELAQRTFPALLDVMADVARRPAFPAEEIDRQRASRLASLVQQRENPNAVAAAVMAAALYGPSHPYGYTELGTETSNKAMSREDMQKFWSQNFVPKNAALVVSGQITVAELRPLVEKAFGDWQGDTPVQPSLGEPMTTGARLVFVDKPGAPQTQIRVAAIGAPRATPDYEALQVMNETLGGLFSSRINLNLREQHGYTYGASSQFVFRRAAGPFVVASGIRTEVTAPAVTEIFKEIRGMREKPPSDDELALAKDSLVRSLPAQFETSSRVTNSTSNIYLYDLGLDYYTKLPARLSAITTEQVKSVATKYHRAEKLMVIAVGDRGKIGAALQKLKLGAVETRNADGTLPRRQRRPVDSEQSARRRGATNTRNGSEFERTFITKGKRTLDQWRPTKRSDGGAGAGNTGA